MAVNAGPMGLLTILKTTLFSACFPRSYGVKIYARFGEDSYFDGETTPLVDDYYPHFVFNVTSFTVAGTLLSNLSWDSYQGGGDLFIFITGALYTTLQPVVIDAIVDVIKKNVSAEPYPLPSGYEICYEKKYEPACRGIEFSFNLDGGGSLHFDFSNIWIPTGGSMNCLAFKRPTDQQQSAFGVTQMHGWNFGFNLDEKKLYYLADDCSALT